MNTIVKKNLIGYYPTDKVMQGLNHNTQHIKLKDIGGLQWPTSNLVQLTGHMLNVFETILKNESWLKLFYKCTIESNSALLSIKEFIFNKLKYMHFAMNLQKCCSEYCKKNKQ